MKLVAIFICWADWDWLEHSVENIKPHVDGVIIIGRVYSNYGEHHGIPTKWFNDKSIELHALASIPHGPPMQSETENRNLGIQIANEYGYTHFIMCDADELYDPIEFRKAKDYMNSKPNLQGLVCKSQVYVKSPTLTIGEDTTLVPFIHKLTPTIRHEFNRRYPFAWIDGKIRIDPTRSLNINSGVEMIDVTMHHYSWVRSDYARKIRNSTARPNIEKMNLAQKVLRLKEGDVFDLYPGKPLVRVPNKFGLPEFNAEVLE
jgi:hypothetical protein